MPLEFFFYISVHRFCMLQISSLSEDIFTNPYVQTGCDTRSVFNRFEFSLRDLLPKEPSLAYYLLIAGGRIIGFIIHTFPKDISAM